VICVTHHRRAFDAIFRNRRALTRLVLREQRFLTDAAFAHVDECRTLSALDVSHCAKLTGDSLHCIPWLSDLDVTSCGSRSRCRDLTGETMRRISSLPLLSALDVAGCDRLMNRAALAHLERCTTLRQPSIGDDTVVYDRDAVLAIACLPSLIALRARSRYRAGDDDRSVRLGVPSGRPQRKCSAIRLFERFTLLLTHVLTGARVRVTGVERAARCYSPCEWRSDDMDPPKLKPLLQTMSQLI
jgi:hypothetical protein